MAVGGVEMPDHFEIIDPLDAIDALYCLQWLLAEADWMIEEQRVEKLWWFKKAWIRQWLLEEARWYATHPLPEYAGFLYPWEMTR